MILSNGDELYIDKVDTRKGEPVIVLSTVKYGDYATHSEVVLTLEQAKKLANNLFDLASTIKTK